MPTVIKDLYDQITNELKNLKTDEDKDQVINNNLIKNDSMFKLICLQ